MRVELIQSTPLMVCLAAAGVCRKSESPERALKNALEVGHDSLLEHWIASFKIEGCSRVLTHQLVRHRIASYAQESQRHVKIEVNNVEWYVAPDSATTLFHSAMQMAGASYLECIEQGMPAEDARYLLPGGCVSNIVATMNARSLQNFFRERLCSRAQWEIRNMAGMMFTLVYRKAPELFQGPFPDCDNCKEPCK